MSDQSAGSIAETLEFLLQRPEGVDPLVAGYIIPVDDLVWVQWDKQLREPFDPTVVDFRMQAGVAVPYIDARLVAQRLTETVGRGRWQFDFEPLVIAQPKPQFDQQQRQKPRPDSLLLAKGVLTIAGIRIPDVGNGWDIEPSKATISDAMKRCAVQVGVFAYAYDLITLFIPEHKVDNGRINPADIERFRSMLPKPGDVLLRTVDPHPVVDSNQPGIRQPQTRQQPTVERRGQQQPAPTPMRRPAPAPAPPARPPVVRNERRATPTPVDARVERIHDDELFDEPVTHSTAGNPPDIDQLRQQFAKLRIDAGYDVDQGRRLIAEAFAGDPRFKGQRLTPDHIYARLNVDDLARVCDILRPIAEQNRRRKKVFAGGRN